jgi:hypothetical protein
MDIIKLDVPLLDVKQDADLHDVAEAVIEMSQDGPVTMANYDQIVSFMQRQGKHGWMLRSTLKSKAGAM